MNFRAFTALASANQVWEFLIFLTCFEVCRIAGKKPMHWHFWFVSRHLNALYRRFFPTCHIPQISYTEDIEDGGSRVCGRQGTPCIPSNRLKISDIVEGLKKSLAASSFLEYYFIIIGE